MTLTIAWKESAYSLDAMYTVQEGRAKGTPFKLHFTQYDNHSDIPSWSGGYGNIFQDERDVKFMVIAPFTIFWMPARRASLPHSGRTTMKKMLLIAMMAAGLGWPAPTSPAPKEDTKLKDAYAPVLIRRKGIRTRLKPARAY